MQKPRTSDGTCGGGRVVGAKSSEPESPLSSSLEERSQSKPQSHSSRPQSQCRGRRMHLPSVLNAASTRCFTVKEIMQLLSPDTTPLSVSSVGPDPRYPPPSGSLLLYDRARTPNYKDDGHDWAMKRVESYQSRLRRRNGGGGDGDTGESSFDNVVREDSVKLRHDGRFRVAGYYARSAVRRTFRRRAYYLVDPANGSRPLSNWILVHYLDADKRRAHHHRRMEDLPVRWDDADHDAGTGGGPMHGKDLGRVVTGDNEPHGVGGCGGTHPIGVDRAEEATGDEEPCDLLHRDASARCWQSPAEPPGADALENQPKPQHQQKKTQHHHQQQQQFEPQLQPQLQPQPELQPIPQPQLQSQPQLPQPQLELEARHEHHRVGASSSLTRTIRSLWDLRNAPKFNEEHLAHEWRSFTEEERSELIADLYGSAMVLEGGDGAAGEDGGTGPVGTSAGATGCGDDDFPPEDMPGDGGTTSPFIRELMAEVEALRMSLMDDAVLEGMPPDCADRAAYLEATRRCPDQAKSRRMRSWFLRCEDMCPTAAAHRMVRYWKKRVEYFGPNRAFLPFTLGDGGTLGTDEFHDEVATGFVRLLPGTDASGRGIMLMDNSKKLSFATRVRVTLYMSHAALENESVVRNGLVLVCFGPMPVQDADRRLILERQQLLRDSLPVTIRAVHWCNPIKDSADWISRDAHEVANFTAGRMWRARVLLHRGSKEHIVLQLGEYGISLSQLPAEIGGGLCEDVFQQWLASRRMRCL